MKLELEYLNDKWWRTFEGYPTTQITKEQAESHLENAVVLEFTDEDNYKYFKIETL
jgi:hypothetical protein